LKLQKRVINNVKQFYFFTTVSLNFHTAKLIELAEKLDDDDKKIFRFDHRDCDWDKLNNLSQQGIRKYLLKEEPETVSKAKRKMKKFWFADIIVKTFYTVLALLITYFVFARTFEFLNLFGFFETFFIN
jgi:Male sterility protein